MSREELLEIYKLHSNHSNLLTNYRWLVLTSLLFLQFLLIYFTTLIGWVLVPLIGYQTLRLLKHFKALNKAKIEELISIEKRLGFDFYNAEYEKYTKDSCESLSVIETGLVRIMMLSVPISIVLYTLHKLKII